MRSILALAGIVILGLVEAAQAKAIAIRIPQPVELVAQAQVIIVGKVTDLEKDLVEVEPAPKAGNKVGYQIAQVKIDESLLGAKGLTTIRVGFQPAPKVVPVQGAVDGGPGIRPIRPIRPFPTTSLAKDQEGLFFLQQHPVGDFYVLVQFSQPLDKKAPNYAKELENVKKTLSIYEKPIEALKAKEAKDRQFAVNSLLKKYRTYPQSFDGRQAKEEPISAEESKLILSIISEMDWGKFDPETGIGMQQLFYQAVKQGTPNGFQAPKFVRGQDYNKMMSEAVKAWLKQNKDTYRIERFVLEKK